MLAATAAYRSNSDLVGEFIAACCHVRSGLRSRAKHLYEGYTEWHSDALGGDPITQQSFGRRLSDRGFDRRKGRTGAYEWHGLGLVQEGDGR